ncbi:MAG: hypothetical protein AAF726_06315 [Planctomycetota bacterium]
MNATPPLPTAEDLASLPYFAILALGARCAKRVAPIFGTWDGATQEQVRAVSRAARSVQELAESPSMVSRVPLWVSARQFTRMAAEAASAADMAEAPVTILSSADAAAELAGAIDPDGNRAPAARAVLRSIEMAAEALDDGEEQKRQEFLGWVGQLVEQLQERAVTEGWTDLTAVTIRDE